MIAPRLRKWWLLSCGVVVLCARVVWASSDAASEGPPRLVVLGDPQFGYGIDGMRSDEERFETVVRHLNRTRPSLVVVPGDLTEDRTSSQKRAAQRALGTIEAEVLLTPGNHDVVDEESLEDYRQQFGADYQVRDLGPLSIVTIDSETARTPAMIPAEHFRQWAFLESTLADRSTRGQTLLLVTHRPPFLRHEGERATDSNWPEESRSRLLELARRYRVKLILAGHTHRTIDVAAEDGLRIVTLAGTARSFDRSPIGYLQVTSRDGEWVVNPVLVGPAPPNPISVPGFREWTPRVFQFSLIHWVFTVLFLVAGWSCRRAAQSKREQPSGTWPLLSWLLFFFAANLQLDFDEALRETGRILARLSGLHDHRHHITATLLAVFLVTSAVGLLRAERRQRNLHAWMAMTAVLVPTLWFVLSAISHHDLRMLFPEPIWYVLQAAAVLVILWGSLRERQRATPTGSPGTRP